MNQLFVNAPTDHHNSTCAELVTMAERELAVLFTAVTELFGSEQARLSAEDWLHVLAAMNGLPASTREW
jgi:DNA-directed RNA polymerase specialized sigma24 family protein